MIEITETTENEQNHKPWLFKPGQSGNPSGRPKGTRNFDTLFTEAIEKIVKEQKINIKDPEVEMVTKAVIEALKGNYPFFRDVMDRRHGRAKLPIEHSIPQNLIDLIRDVIPTREEDNQTEI